MKIQQTNLISYTYPNYSLPNTSFRSNMRNYTNSVKNSISGAYVYTTTCLFRNDLDAMKIIKYAAKHFKDKKRVNIMCLAGSDGSEAYTMKIALNETLKPDARKKFEPIYSYDKDQEIIKAAKSGRINLSKADFENLKKQTNTKTKYFINPKPLMEIKNDLVDPENYLSYEPIPELKQAIKFSRANLLDKLDNLEDNGNSIVLCRNVTPYLDSYDVSDIAYNLNQNLKKGSLVVLGQYDKHTKIIDYLKYYDFKEIFENVFECTQRNLQFS